jgi:Fe-S-cluster containining protein
LDEEIQEFLDNQIPPASISIDKKIQPVPEPGQAGFICPFLNAGDNNCKIYSLRPLECQLYPFLIAVRGKKVILTLDLNCPYIKENLSSKELKDYIEYLTDFLNSQSQVRLLKDNPQIIQAYQDVLDVVELKATDGPGAAGK